VQVAAAEQLRPETVSAFNSYVQQNEKRMSDEIASGRFLHIDTLSGSEKQKTQARLYKGEVVSEPVSAPNGQHPLQVPHGLIHHWIGTVFIPGATLDRTLSFLQNYDDAYKFYSPDVQRSRLLERNGDEFKVFMRLKKTKFVTVILDTAYDVQYVSVASDRAASYSRSTRIAEVENAGKANESEKPVGNDSGFMWRLNSYWRFLQRDGGVYIQLEAISLTRDIPTGVGWLVGPFVTDIPRESLAFTLTKTRLALMNAGQERSLR